MFMVSLCYRLWISRESNRKPWGWFLSRQGMEYRRFRVGNSSGPAGPLAIK